MKDGSIRDDLMRREGQGVGQKVGGGWRFILTQPTSQLDMLPIASVQFPSSSPHYTSKDSIELALKLQHLKFPATAKLISFDVENVYTRIPVQQAIDIMAFHLQQAHVSKEVIGEFENLLTHCIGRNLCIFRETTDQFPDGLPVGGTLIIGCGCLPRRLGKQNTQKHQ